ncbi:hypothetical protein MRS76_19000 [Rhizobiaceae bacterium n13]|uniref:SGNH/GDSL hydrolase family protein n=1 Tax=Ferirhizobium litorale TaxID=2927786 RepID=A0AAE3U5H1_9HYPH|nr:hypothetical protein [Fererhizobium litorale]MDI7864039.1 hypothetical protein [Fererhizobium litorale]MDI7924478.1 hypothetical protein [Fererhizobium litorale]
MSKPGTMRRLLFLGDSHTKYFVYAARKGLLGERQTSSCIVFGATARGLTNPQSRTGALLKFNEFLAQQPDRSVLLLHLGEVDCGFVIWYQAQEHARSIQSQMAQSVDSYFAFIDEIRNRYRHTLLVTGATVPTIRDGTDWGEVAHMRRKVTATLSDRTNLTLDFNEELRIQCTGRSIEYLDITSQLLDPVTGVVDNGFRNPDEADHHLNKRVVAPIWANTLNPVLDRLSW